MDNIAITAEPATTVVLRVNGEPISKEALRAKAANLRLQRESSGIALSISERAHLQTEAREILVDRLLLIQEAAKQRLALSADKIDRILAQRAMRSDGVAACRVDAESTAMRSELAESLMIEALLDSWRAQVKRPRNEEASQYYREHRSSFWRPESVQAAHIVRNFEAEFEEAGLLSQVETLRARVVQGEEFRLIAEQYSDCPENGGDLGWIFKGAMVPEFDDVVFKASVGILTPVFRTEFGFHFALVRARRAAGELAFMEVREQIAEGLWLQKQDREVGRALGELRRKAVIEAAQ